MRLTYHLYRHACRVVILICFISAGFVNNAAAQRKEKCVAIANEIYFVEDGKSVLDVHPGARGYQLNILGTGAVPMLPPPNGR